MSWIDRLYMFSPLDYTALVLLLLAWAGIGWRVENPSQGRPSVARIMNGYRRDWMRHMVTRQPRIFDSSLIGNLRQSTAFFASATMIALGGGLALIRNPDPVANLASDLALGAQPHVVWEIKLLLVLLFLTSAFLKFVWANRLFGYCSVVMGAVPNDIEDPQALVRAAQAAELNITAARSFKPRPQDNLFRAGLGSLAAGRLGTDRGGAADADHDLPARVRLLLPRGSAGGSAGHAVVNVALRGKRIGYPHETPLYIHAGTLRPCRPAPGAPSRR